MNFRGKEGPVFLSIKKIKDCDKLKINANFVIIKKQP
jgi:hypothetical protein